MKKIYCKECSHFLTFETSDDLRCVSPMNTKGTWLGKMIVNGLRKSGIKR